VNPHMNLKSRMKFAFIKFCVERNHIELPWFFAESFPTDCAFDQV
jgi:hypothetical protein